MARLDHRTCSGPRAREVQLTFESPYFNPTLAPTAGVDIRGWRGVIIAAEPHIAKVRQLGAIRASRIQ